MPGMVQDLRDVCNILVRRAPPYLGRIATKTTPVTPTRKIKLSGKAENFATNLGTHMIYLFLVLA